MKIIGPPTANPFRAGANMQTLGATPLFRDELAPALWAAALRYGVDPAVMLAQSALETGWAAFTRAVKPYHHNTCGLKIWDPKGLADDDPRAHAQFASWEAGAIAHAQHLLAYCQVNVLLLSDQALLDPRYVHVLGKRAPIVNVEELGGAWAPRPTYGNDIAALAAKLAA